MINWQNAVPGTYCLAAETTAMVSIFIILILAFTTWMFWYEKKELENKIKEAKP